jgi:hypothetical protein
MCKAAGFPVRSMDVFDIPCSEGILISQVEGKVATLDSPKNCIIIPSKGNEICPVKNFRKYNPLYSQNDTRLKNRLNLLRKEIWLMNLLLRRPCITNVYITVLIY